MGSLGLTSGGSQFRLATWKAYSVYNKRLGIESLLHTQGLDVLGVTESWLSPEDVWEVREFMSYRADKLDSQGVRVLILVSRVFQVFRVAIMPGRRGDVDCVGVVLAIVQGPVVVLCSYAPPGPVIEKDEWSSVLERMRT